MMQRHSRKNSLNLPPLIFGTTVLGNIYQSLSEQRKYDILKAIFDLKKSQPMVLDSAGKYGAGLALEVIGRNLKKLRIEPDEVIISNKLGWFRTPLTTPEPTFEPGVWMGLQHDAVQKISYEGILECWQQGCQLLGGEYQPQMVSVHDPDEYLAKAESETERRKLFEDVRQAYQALEELKHEGKIQTVGVGAKDWTVIREIVAEVKLDWVMFAISFTILTHPRGLMDFMAELAKKQILIINSALFHGGFLTGGNYFDYRLLNPDDEKDRRLFEWRSNFFNLWSNLSNSK